MNGKVTVLSYLYVLNGPLNIETDPDSRTTGVWWNEESLHLACVVDEAPNELATQQVPNHHRKVHPT